MVDITVGTFSTGILYDKVNISFSSPPVLKLENSRGLSDDDLKQLKNEVNKLAHDLCGEVSLHCANTRRF